MEEKPATFEEVVWAANKVIGHTRTAVMMGVTTVLIVITAAVYAAPGHDKATVVFLSFFVVICAFGGPFMPDGDLTTLTMVKAEDKGKEKHKRGSN